VPRQDFEEPSVVNNEFVLTPGSSAALIGGNVIETGGDAISAAPRTSPSAASLPELPDALGWLVIDCRAGHSRAWR
jgi:hypothetical protein